MCADSDDVVSASIPWEKKVKFMRALAIQAAREDHLKAMTDHRKLPRKRVLKPRTK